MYFALVILNVMMRSFMNFYFLKVKRILVNFGEKFKSQPEDQVDLDSWAMFSYSLQIIQITGTYLHCGLVYGLLTYTVTYFMVYSPTQ